MKINCLSCGHNFGISDAYDDYEGSVKCFVCGNLMMIRTDGGKLKSALPLSLAGVADAAAGAGREG